MEKQPSNVGNFVIQHVDEKLEHVANVSDEASDEFADTSVSPAPSVMTNSHQANSKLEKLTQSQMNGKLKSNLEKSSKLLNYSHDDINVLASKAEFLVLTGSNNDLTAPDSSDDDEGLHRDNIGVDGLDLQSLDTRYDEPCLSGTWEHDIQVSGFLHTTIVHI